MASSTDGRITRNSGILVQQEALLSIELNLRGHLVEKISPKKTRVSSSRDPFDHLRKYSVFG